MVVQVHLDFTKAHSAQLDQRIDVLRAVFLFRVEKRMDGLPPVSVSQALAQGRVFLAPTRHAGAFDFIAGLLVLRLEMIDKTEHEMARLPSRRLAVRPVAPEIGPQPRLDVLLANFAQKHRSSRQSRSPHPHYHQVHRYSKLLRRHDIRRS